jgi:hypothetical protein
MAPVRTIAQAVGPLGPLGLSAAALVGTGTLMFLMGGLTIRRSLFLWLAVLLCARLVAALGSSHSGFVLQWDALARDVIGLAIATIAAAAASRRMIFENLRSASAASFAVVNLLFLAAYVAFGSQFLLETRAAEFARHGIDIAQVEDYRGGIGNPVDYAVGIVMFTPMFVSEALRAQTYWRRLIGYACLCIAVVAVAVTFSRLSLVAFLWLAAVTAYLQRGLRLTLRTALITIALGVSPMLLLLDSNLKEYAASRWGVGTSLEEFLLQQDPSSISRIGFALHGFELFTQHPFFGVGGNNLSALNERTFGVANTAENMYIQMLAEYGVLYFGLFSFCLVYVVVMSLRQADPDIRLSGSMILGILTVGIYTPINMDLYAYLVAGLALGLFWRRRVSLEHAGAS